MLTCEAKKWKRWSNIQDVASHRMLNFLEKTHADLLKNREEGTLKRELKGWLIPSALEGMLKCPGGVLLKPFSQTFPTAPRNYILFFPSSRLSAENGAPPNYLASLSSAAPSSQTIASKCRQLYLSVKSLLEEEAPLPFGWERTSAPDGNASYFVDHAKGTSSWSHPVTGESTYLGGGDGGRGGGGDDEDDGQDFVSSNAKNEEAFPPFVSLTPVIEDGENDDDDDISRVVSDRTFNEVSLL